MLFPLLCSTLASAEPLDEDEVRRRIFMPALEAGAVVSSDPDVDVGLLFRTSLEYRFERVRAPFLRLSYDATTATHTSRQPGGPRLESNAGFHDLLVGGGWRFGPDRVQVVGALQGGVQLAEIPRLKTSGSTWSVKNDLRVRPMATAGLGAELYVFRGIALTSELSARVPIDLDDPSVSAALTVGVTTSL